MKLDGEKVRRARDQLGLSIELVGEEAEVAKNSVLRAEHGEDIRPSTARKIAAALRARVAELLPEEEGAESKKAAAPSEPGPPSEEATEERRRPWRTEVGAFIAEADEVLDLPDLSQDVCYRILDEATTLYLEVAQARQRASREKGYTWKELNDLSVAEQDILRFSNRVGMVFRNKFGEAQKAQVEGLLKAVPDNHEAAG